MNIAMASNNEMNFSTGSFPSSIQSTKPKKTKKKRSTTSAKKRRPKGKPTRPLSAYNIFFRSERKRMLASLGQSDNSKAGRERRGSISFENLAKTVASKWHALDSGDRHAYEMAAVSDNKRYRAEMEAWRGTDEGKEHEIWMKKERMARRAGSKFDDFGFDRSSSRDDDANSVFDTFDDDNLTPLQRMFQRGDAMVQQAEGEKKSETNSHPTSQSSMQLAYHHATPSAMVVEKQMTQVHPVIDEMASPRIAVSDQSTGGNGYVKPASTSVVDHTSSSSQGNVRVFTSAWVQETKALLNRGQGLIQNVRNVQDAHTALEKHSKRSALSFEAGLLPTSTNNIPASHSKSTSRIGMTTKQCTAATTSLLLSMPPTALPVPINTSAKKLKTVASVSSLDSIGTIESLTNLFGSNQNIQSLLAANNGMMGKLEMSAENLKRVFSIGEKAAAFRRSTPTLKMAGTNPELPQSKINATWHSLDIRERSSMPTFSKEIMMSASTPLFGNGATSKNSKQDLARFASMLLDSMENE